MSQDTDMLDIGIFLMRMVTERIHFTSIYNKLFRTIIITFILITLTASVYNISKVEKEIVMKNLEAIITEMHVLLMYVIFIYNQKLIALIINDKTYFQSTSNTRLKKKIADIQEWVKKILLTFTICGYCTILSLFLALLSDQDKFLIFESWSPDDYIFAGLYSLVQLIMLIVAGSLTMGLDCMLFASCCHLIIQVKLLKYDLSILCIPVDTDIATEGRIKRNFIKCVEHHKFIMRFFENLRNLSSSLFLGQYVIALISICTQLYAFSITKEEFDTTELFKSTFYTSTIVLEFGMYCFSSQYVTDEMKSISDAIYYGSQWYECKTYFQKDLMFIIMKSQKQGEFSAGGLLAMNIAAFTSVMRKAFSFYALMKSLF